MAEPTESESLQVEILDLVVVATLNRPHRRNALDDSLLAALRRLWGESEALAGIRAIVITGAEPAFCSGADMSLLSSNRDDAPTAVRDELSFLPGLQVECPVIVAVNGVCAGAGLHFVADADIALAAEDAVFLDPHVSVGQVSALEPISLLLRARAQAITRMVLLGSAERLTAAQALEAGLVSEVVRKEDLRGRALELAAAIAANSPAAVASSRRALRSFEHELLARALEDGWAAIRAHWDHPDAGEGPLAFTEKRVPRWRER